MDDLHRLPRRKLLTVLGAGLAGGMFPRFVRAAPPSEKLRLAFLGLGPQGLANLAAFAEQEIAAICDVDESLIGPLRDQFPKAEATADFRRVLDRRDLDAIVISTPDHSHAYLTALAIARGLPVYGEKPLAHTVAECDYLAKAATAKKVVTALGNHKIARPNYRRGVEILRRGLLGPVREVHGWTTRPHWPQGFDRPKEAFETPRGLRWDDWLGPASERSFNPAYHPRKWRGWKAFGTGGLGDFGNDLFDAVWEGLELGQPTKISAETSPRHAETFPEASTITFEFPAGGDRPAVRLTYYDGGRKPPESVAGGARLPDDGTLVIGDEAQLYLSPFDGPPRQIGPRKRELTIPPDPRPETLSHHQAFLAAVRAQTPFDGGFQRGSEQSRYLLLGLIAQELGRPLAWNAARSTFDDPAADHLLASMSRKGWELPN